MYITQNNPDGCFVSVSNICNMQIPPFRLVRLYGEKCKQSSWKCDMKGFDVEDIMAALTEVPDNELVL